MSAESTGSHAQFATALRARVQETGTLDHSLRKGILDRGAGGPAVAEPYDSLAREIAEDSYRVTDEQVSTVLGELGSEGNAFEVILTAAIGAGLRRWDAAAATIGEADDAAS
ncbi:hypothetical protein HII28_19625 [Planctomonas sp. JC2975]|uniref:hypothetical protein n=1 Tax=Planctomonas sp. JC2975 TaxID=2729626 RepID=UPI0014736FFB|nr:hypothetical protein [Planctomonas sp. JC2975]NNC14074.1 hypothetical protein [Planctomonas sp. JC2975]